MGGIRLGGEIRRPAAVFMDCDGVIFDSNDLKVRAVREALADQPEADRERMVAYHRAHGGVSRYDKLRWFFREVRPTDDPEPAIAAALERFGRVARQGYDALAPRPEALAFAAHFGASRAYVLSGSDQRELRAIFDAQRVDGEPLAARFADVLGSPTRKREHIERVLDAIGASTGAALMVGDGSGDFGAARALGVPFVFLAEMSDWADASAALAGERACWIAEDWRQLCGWLTS